MDNKNKKAKKLAKTDSTTTSTDNEKTNNPPKTETQTSTLISTAEEKENEKLLALHSKLHATTQLGGKGTMRRRRLRKTSSLNSDLSNSEMMRAFLNKFEFNDYGNIERVTFIEDNGQLTSYDSVKLNANLKYGFFHINLSQYKNNQTKKRRISKSKIAEEPKRSSSAEQLPQKGVKINRAEDLLEKLVRINNSDILTTVSSENLNMFNRNNFIRNEIYELVGSDAYEYLENINDKLNKTLTETVHAKSELKESKNIDESTLNDKTLERIEIDIEIDDQTEFIPDLENVDFEAESNKENFKVDIELEEPKLINKSVAELLKKIMPMESLESIEDSSLSLSSQLPESESERKQIGAQESIEEISLSSESPDKVQDEKQKIEDSSVSSQQVENLSKNEPIETSSNDQNLDTAYGSLSKVASSSESSKLQANQEVYSSKLNSVLEKLADADQAVELLEKSESVAKKRDDSLGNLVGELNNTSFEISNLEDLEEEDEQLSNPVDANNNCLSGDETFENIKSNKIETQQPTEETILMIEESKEIAETQAPGSILTSDLALETTNKPKKSKKKKSDKSKESSLSLPYLGSFETIDESNSDLNLNKITTKAPIKRQKINQKQKIKRRSLNLSANKNAHPDDRDSSSSRSRSSTPAFKKASLDKSHISEISKSKSFDNTDELKSKNSNAIKTVDYSTDTKSSLALNELNSSTNLKKNSDLNLETNDLRELRNLAFLRYKPSYTKPKKPQMFRNEANRIQYPVNKLEKSSSFQSYDDRPKFADQKSQNLSTSLASIHKNSSKTERAVEKPKTSNLKKTSGELSINTLDQDAKVKEKKSELIDYDDKPTSPVPPSKPAKKSKNKTITKMESMLSSSSSSLPSSVASSKVNITESNCDLPKSGILNKIKEHTSEMSEPKRLSRYLEDDIDKGAFSMMSPNLGEKKKKNKKKQTQTHTVEKSSSFVSTNLGSLEHPNLINKSIYTTEDDTSTSKLNLLKSYSFQEFKNSSMGDSSANAKNQSMEQILMSTDSNLNLDSSQAELHSAKLKKKKKKKTNKAELNKDVSTSSDFSSQIIYTDNKLMHLDASSENKQELINTMSGINTTENEKGNLKPVEAASELIEKNVINNYLTDKDRLNKLNEIKYIPLLHIKNIIQDTIANPDTVFRPESTIYNITAQIEQIKKETDFDNQFKVKSFKLDTYDNIIDDLTYKTNTNLSDLNKELGNFLDNGNNEKELSELNDKQTQIETKLDELEKKFQVLHDIDVTKLEDLQAFDENENKQGLSENIEIVHDKPSEIVFECDHLQELNDKQCLIETKLKDLCEKVEVLHDKPIEIELDDDNQIKLDELNKKQDIIESKLKCLNENVEKIYDKPSEIIVADDENDIKLQELNERQCLIETKLKNLSEQVEILHEKPIEIDADNKLDDLTESKTDDLNGIILFV